MDKIINKYPLIATRVPLGDNWMLHGDSTEEIFPSLTLVLEAYFQLTGYKGAYKLDPLDSKLYTIIEVIEEVIEPVVEEIHYGLYGEGTFKQGA